MKITIEVENLIDFIEAYNNAIYALTKYGQTCFFGLTDNIPTEMYKHLEKKLGTTDPRVWQEYFDQKFYTLRNVYDQLLEIEKNEQNKGD